MTELLAGPFATLAFGNFGAQFWIDVGVLAAIYGIFTAGLQLNVGFTGLYNFAQAGFMAVGAYAMGILTASAGWSFWLALPAATVITVVFALLIGAPALRLRGDYFAIGTIAFSEVIRYVIQNTPGLTGGNQGLLGFDEAWSRVADGVLEGLALSRDYDSVPLLVVGWVTLIVVLVVLARLQRSPWGRALKAIREDEHAARALGKSAFALKLQSLSIGAALAGVAGYLLALDLSYLSPQEFLPISTFIGFTMLLMGGLGSYTGVAMGAVVTEFLLDGTRAIELPLSDAQVAPLRFMIVGALLILLAVLRPQGLLGKREEMVLRR